MIPERSIFWHQGLFLQPQHFQHFDRYVSSLISPAYQFIQPYLWGLRTITFNESALLNRVVELTEFEALFQDNSWAVLGKNCSIAPRSFADLDFDFTGKDIFTVYLGLKRVDRFEANVTQVNRNAAGVVDTRYWVDRDPEEVNDMYVADGTTAQVSFLEYNVRLFWPDEMKDNDQYLFLPIARLQMKGEDIHLDKTYIPPTFQLSGASGLIQTIKHIREQTLARCRVLETYKSSQNQSVEDLELTNLYYISALGYLNRYLAALTHITETPVSHPWNVYGVLREMVAELSCFSERVNALGQLRDGTDLLPEYDHLNLNDCFSDIQRLVVELLGSIVVGSENVIPLNREEFLFSCDIPSEFLRQRGMYCLMVRTETKDEDLIDSIARHAKVANCFSIETLIARSLRGIPLIYREVPPLGMARHADRLCFEIDTGNHLWKDIATDGRLCLFWEAAPDTTAIDLVITKL